MCGKHSSEMQGTVRVCIDAYFLLDWTKKANIAKRGHMYQTSFTPNNDGFNNELPSETPNRDPTSLKLAHEYLGLFL